MFSFTTGDIQAINLNDNALLRTTESTAPSIDTDIPLTREHILIAIPHASDLTVEAILDELPDEVLESLPPEDLKRLTPETARELVDSLMASFADKKKPKKKVKVRKVKRVKKVKKRTREVLIEKIPKEVKASLPDDALASLSIDDLEALVAGTGEPEAQCGVRQS